MTEPGLWTVGFYNPDGEFITDSDHDSKEDAAKRVHYLNGGSPVAPDMLESLEELYGWMSDQCKGDNFQPMLARAYRALQKAKGKTIDPRKHNRHNIYFKAEGGE